MRRPQDVTDSMPGSGGANDTVDDLSAALDVLRREISGLATAIEAVSADVAALRTRIEQLGHRTRTDAADRAAIAALPRAALMSDLLALDGPAAERLAVRRLTVGDAVEQPFTRWVGASRCVSPDPAVRDLWQRLLALEAACGDTLRGNPSSILDVPRGTLARGDDGSLRVRAGAADVAAAEGRSAAWWETVAVPRFTYDFPNAKLGNFGHWLVDCLPHIVPLLAVAPHARVLLPAPVKRFHRALLSMLGVTDAQIVEWDGAPVASARLLVLESDGRLGGGRPLSGLIELRRLVAPPAAAANGGRRRIYVSRRDAGVKGAWIANEPEVEDAFRRRGFDVLVMSEIPLDEQMRAFREAAVVAGVSGAGLTDLVFSRPGTHVIVLLSDRLMRWYAKPGKARAKWASGQRAGERHLAALGDSPRFYTHLAAACDQYSHSFLSADTVPIDELTSFVDEVLAKAEAR